MSEYLLQLAAERANATQHRDDALTKGAAQLASSWQYVIDHINACVLFVRSL